MSAPLRQLPLTLLFSLTFLFTTSQANWLGPFDGSACRDHILSLIAQNATIIEDPSLFYLDSDQQPLANYTGAPVLTEPGCESMCSAQYAASSNTAQRLLTWFVPVFLLLTNLHYPDIGKSKYLAVFHLLGDPITSNLALLLEVNKWQQHSHYGDDSAVIAAALGVARDDHRGAQAGKTPWLDRVNLPPSKMRSIAVAVRDIRVREMVRAWGALGLYVFQVIAAFWGALGGSPSPSGGMIGPAMVLSWLLPMVLLSNSVGSFSSPRARFRTVKALLKQERVSHLHSSIGSTRLSEINLLGRRLCYRATKWSESLPWSGGIQFYQPSLISEFDLRSRKEAFSILFWLAIPTSAAFATAFAVLDTPPTYLTCRGFAILAIFLVWLWSFACSLLVHRTSVVTGVYAWYGVLFKDILISVSVIIILVGTSSGWFTSCWCLSGRWTYAVPRVYLFSRDQFALQSNVTYPIAVSICLGVQCFVWAAVTFQWRKAFRIWTTDNSRYGNVA
ncbi:hypothetical protein MMC10_004995 [Thelotrema lepadinum]|nr:hypothetical protein [Thelotrema lepadinum]